MQEVFASQISTESFTRVVTFIVMEDDNRETVQSWRKSKIDEIASTFDYVDTAPNRLPRFIRK